MDGQLFQALLAAAGSGTIAYFVGRSHLARSTGRSIVEIATATDTTARDAATALAIGLGRASPTECSSPPVLMTVALDLETLSPRGTAVPAEPAEPAELPRPRSEPNISAIE